MMVQVKRCKGRVHARSMVRLRMKAQRPTPAERTMRMPTMSPAVRRGCSVESRANALRKAARTVQDRVRDDEPAERKDAVAGLRGVLGADDGCAQTARSSGKGGSAGLAERAARAGKDDAEQARGDVRGLERRPDGDQTFAHGVHGRVAKRVTRRMRSKNGVGDRPDGRRGKRAACQTRSRTRLPAAREGGCASARGESSRCRAALASSRVL
jgi:hypothetical protein